MSAEEKDIDNPSFCKPFRFSQLVTVGVCFSLLFFLRQFSPEDEIVCSPSALIVMFTTIAPTFLITLIDVFCQGIREPIPNSPMILTLLLSSTSCLIAAITSLLVYTKRENFRSYRNLNTLCLLAGFSFLASLLYILDALIVIRFSC